MTVLLQLIASFIGTISFAIVFDTPKKYYLYCGIIGSIGWGIYLVVLHLTDSLLIATFVSALSLIYMAREASFGLRAPVTIFLICGIFCLVPGLGVYQFAYEFFVGDSLHAAVVLVKVIQIAIAIALGITFGYELPPQCFFAYRHRKKLER
ncbi:threonine/serine exporter family protein [Enterococcus saccharolyticus]|uniref:threonine/serine exporter family protein n=1 Tax=Enterococcus saccharolyticus TaxID=41997 RepID=UPI001E2E9566|nr:threonine/serine exporter family protein [Enterococcus saccharolyticus]MCD5003451.1 threonine/serine exporter family protein [Enterococcus saccharolyticus]